MTPGHRVLVAVKRPPGYEDVHAEWVVEDASRGIRTVFRNRSCQGRGQGDLAHVVTSQAQQACRLTGLRQPLTGTSIRRADVTARRILRFRQLLEAHDLAIDMLRAAIAPICPRRVSMPCSRSLPAPCPPPWLQWSSPCASARHPRPHRRSPSSRSPAGYLLRLEHLRVSFAALVLGRTGRRNDRGVQVSDLTITCIGATPRHDGGPRLQLPPGSADRSIRARNCRATGLSSQTTALPSSTAWRP